jgi:hypothetical protein
VVVTITDQKTTMSRTKKKQKRRPLCPNNGSCSWCAQGRQHRKIATAEHADQDIQELKEADHWADLIPESEG